MVNSGTFNLDNFRITKGIRTVLFQGITGVTGTGLPDSLAAEQYGQAVVFGAQNNCIQLYYPAFGANNGTLWVRHYWQNTGEWSSWKIVLSRAM